MMYDVCWRIFYGDVFLGYAYAVDSDTAINNSLNAKGVASRYGQPKEKLRAEKA